MGWWSKAWDNVSDAASAVGGAVYDAGAAVVETAGTIKDVADGAVSKTFGLDWEEEKVAEAAWDGAVEGTKAVVETGVEAVKQVAAVPVGIVVNTAQTVGLDVEAEWAETRLDTQLEVTGLKTAGTWIAETGAPAVWTGVQYVGAASPLGYIANGVDAMTGWDPTGLAAKNDEVLKFGKWAMWDDPGRAWSLAAQGVTDAALGTVGFVGDLGKAALWEYTLHPLGSAIYNIGADIEVFATDANGAKVTIDDENDLKLSATNENGETYEIHVIDEKMYLIDAEGEKTDVRYGDDGNFFVLGPDGKPLDLGITNGSFSMEGSNGETLSGITIDASSQKANLTSDRGFFHWSTAIHDNTQFVDPILAEIDDFTVTTTAADGTITEISDDSDITFTGVNPDGVTIEITLSDEQLSMKDENGNEIEVGMSNGQFFYLDENDQPVNLGLTNGQLSMTGENGSTTNNVTLDLDRINNPHATYERIMLYSGQAIFEVPAFIGVSVLSGGTASALYAAKWGGTGVRVAQTVNAIRRADLVVDALRHTSKLQKVLKPLEEANTLLKAARTASRQLDNVGSALGKSADEMAALAGKSADEIAELTGKSADEILALTGKSADEISEMAQKASQVPQLTQRVSAATETLENASRATNNAAKADNIVQGNRAGSLGDNAMRAVPGGKSIATGASKITQSDVMEYLGKYADELRTATTKLDELTEAGGASQRALNSAQNAVNKASGRLDDALHDVNMLTRNAENGLTRVSREVAETATRTTEDLSGLANTGNRITRNIELGAYRGWRFSDPMRSPIIEAAGVTGAFGLGYYMDVKQAEAGLEMSKASAAGKIESETERNNEIDAEMRAIEEEMRQQGTFNGQPTDGSLRDQFSPQGTLNGQGSGANDGHDNSGDTSNTFNNRSTGTVTPLNNPVIVLEVPDDVARNLESTLGNK